MGRPRNQDSQPETISEDSVVQIEPKKVVEPKAKAVVQDQFLKVSNTRLDGSVYEVPKGTGHKFHVELQRAERKARSMPGESIFISQPFVATYHTNEWRQMTTPAGNYPDGHPQAGQPNPDSTPFAGLGMDRDWCTILHVPTI